MMIITMKRITILLATILLSTTLFSRNNSLNSQFYFRFGLSEPTWKYYNASSKSDWDDYSRTGAEFEIGSIFMLKVIHLGDKMRIGLNVDYLSINVHHFQSTSSSDYQNTNYFIGSKIGAFVYHQSCKKTCIRCLW